MQCHSCSFSEIDAGWRYCVSCGVPVREPCPYSPADDDHEHVVPIGCARSTSGRCPKCGGALRYCPYCGRVHTIRDAVCREHKDIHLNDYRSSYASIAGGSRWSGSIDCANGVYKPPTSGAPRARLTIGEPIVPPIHVYGFIYCFLPNSQVLLRVDDNLAHTTIYRSRNLGSGCAERLITNLAAERGVVGVLLDDRAQLIDAMSLDTLHEIRGDFRSQVLTEDTWFLTGKTPAGKVRLVAVDTQRLDTIGDDAPEEIGIDSNQRPISDGNDIYLLDRNRILKISRSASKVSVRHLVTLSQASGTFGQMVVSDGSLLVLSGSRDILRVTRDGQVSQMPLSRDVLATRIWASGNTVAVLQSGQIGLVDSHGQETSGYRLPGQTRLSDMMLASFRDSLDTVFITHTTDLGFDNFSSCLRGTTEVTSLQVAASNLQNGFVCGDEAVFIYARASVRDQILRVDIGERQ